MEYCDVLAAIIIEGLKTKFTGEVAFFGAKSKLDLDPEGGFLVSTKKTITCRDNKGNSYKVTVEANPDAAQASPSLEEVLHESNIRCSRNGDPLSFYIESLAAKLTFANQDRSVLAEITPAELEVLAIEVAAAQDAKENKIESF